MKAGHYKLQTTTKSYPVGQTDVLNIMEYLASIRTVNIYLASTGNLEPQTAKDSLS